MSESARLKALETYKYFVDFYAIRGLWERLVAVDFRMEKILADIRAAKPHVPQGFDHTFTGAKAAGPKEAAATWSHQCSLLDGIQTQEDVRTALGRLIDKSFEIVERTKKSKGKDDSRGERIIPGYRAAHKRAEDDKVVAEAEEAARELEEQINQYLQTSLKSNL